MENYVQKLIKEIDMAVCRVNIRMDEERDFMDQIKLIENLIANEPQRTLGEHVGLQIDSFPLSSDLSNSQMNLLINALEELYEICGVLLDLPNKLPLIDCYEFYLEALHTKLDLIPGGFLHIEFCEYEPNNCPFGTEHCQCLEFDEKGSFDLDEVFEEENLEIIEQALKEKVKSRYTLHLIDDITAAYQAFLDPEEALMLMELEEDDLEEDCLILGQKSIAEWVGIDLSQFPVAEKIHKEDALAIVLFLFAPWDCEEEMVNDIMSIKDPIARYQQVLNFFDQTVRFDGKASFFIDPLTAAELDSLVRQMPELLDDPMFDSLFGEEEDDWD